MEIRILFTIFIATLIVVSAYFLFKELVRLYKKVINLENRIFYLEQASLKRLPFRSYDETLDAMAALDALEHEEQFKQDLIQNAKAHLANSMRVGTKKEMK